MTDAEKQLWARIRGKQLKGYQFYRQKPVGDFIVDFYCPKANLVLNVAQADRILFDRRIPPKGYVIETCTFNIPPVPYLH